MSSLTETVKTRLLIISDTHNGRSLQPYSESGAFRPPLPECDVLLHSGDLTMVGTMSEYRDALAMLREMPGELKLVIAGNHDLSLHEDYYLNDKGPAGTLHAQVWQGKSKYDRDLPRQALELWTGPEAKAAGITFLTEGLHTFTLSNGAQFTIYASPWQPEFYNWAFNYPHSEDRWNPPHLIAGKDVSPAPFERDPHPIPEGADVDIIMTHGPPHMHLDRCKPSGYRAGCSHLLRALERVRPRLHCFGHIHEAWGAERVTWKTQSAAATSGAGTGELGEVTEVLGGRNDGGMGVTVSTPAVIRPDDADVITRRAAYLDLSSNSGKPLKAKKETLFINSCVVDVDYQAENAGWLVELELPKQQG